SALAAYLTDRPAGFNSPNRLEGKADFSVKCSEGAEQRPRFKGCGAACGQKGPVATPAGLAASG
ncbi:MAG: hypothetical protein E7K47_16695, partial [Acidovorax sp.]|nr:hypothetical protein [Acidovorax sp.]